VQKNFGKYLEPSIVDKSSKFGTCFWLEDQRYSNNLYDNIRYDLDLRNETLDDKKAFFSDTNKAMYYFK
jgi:hypothetical protein